MSLFKIQGSCIAIKASSKKEAIKIYKTTALSSKIRRYIGDVIKDVGFRIEEFDVGDSKTMIADKNTLTQNYAKILVIYEGVDKYRIGLDIPKVKDEFSTVVVKSRILSESELAHELKVFGIRMKTLEEEYEILIRKYNSKLKSIVKDIWYENIFS